MTTTSNGNPPPIPEPYAPVVGMQPWQNGSASGGRQKGASSITHQGAGRRHLLVGGPMAINIEDEDGSKWRIERLRHGPPSIFPWRAVQSICRIRKRARRQRVTREASARQQVSAPATSVLVPCAPCDSFSLRRKPSPLIQGILDAKRERLRCGC